MSIISVTKQWTDSKYSKHLKYIIQFNLAVFQLKKLVQLHLMYLDLVKMNLKSDTAMEKKSKEIGSKNHQEQDKQIYA